MLLIKLYYYNCGRKKLKYYFAYFERNFFENSDKHSTLLKRICLPLKGLTHLCQELWCSWYSFLFIHTIFFYLSSGYNYLRTSLEFIVELVRFPRHAVRFLHTGIQPKERYWISHCVLNQYGPISGMLHLYFWKRHKRHSLLCFLKCQTKFKLLKAISFSSFTVEFGKEWQNDMPYTKTILEKISN